MEIVRRFGLWIIAGVIILLALGFEFTVVQKVAKQRVAKVDELESRHDSLEGHAERPNDIPGTNWIPIATEGAKKISSQLDKCAKYLSDQPRRCHTRLFFEDEESGLGKEVEGEYEWLILYNKYNAKLQEQLSEAGLFGWQPSVLADWGSGVPTAEQISEAQQLHWFQKDLADTLTDQVARDFAEFLRPPPDNPNVFPNKPSDLVVTRKIAGRPELDEPLRFVDIEKLRAVLEAILINEEQLDLATIFDKHLSSGDDAKNFDWARVLGLTMDPEQKEYLDALIPPKEDLANRQRFVDFAMELRTLRYRSDVVGLLENHDDGINDFKKVAAKVKQVSPMDRVRLLKEIREDWTSTRIAQTIAAIVSVRDEKDYRLLRENHSPQIASIGNVTVERPMMDLSGMAEEGFMGGRPGVMPGARDAFGGPRRPVPATSPERRSAPSPTTRPGAEPSRMPGRSGLESRMMPGTERRFAPRGETLYKTTRFGMSVRLEFEHLPIFLRRLLSNSWHYQIRIETITPAEGTFAESRGLSQPSMRSPRTGIQPSAPMAAYRTPRPSTDREPSFTTAGREMAAPLRNYVDVAISGEGYQFVPLLEKLEKEKKAVPERTPGGETPAPAAGPARTTERPVRPETNP